MIDVQSKPSEIQMPITNVGISDIMYPIFVSNKCGGTQSTVGTFTCSVNLKADQKGTHMSRFITQLHSFAKNKPFSLELFKVFQHDLLSVLPDADYCEVSVSFPFFIVKEAPVSGNAGLLNYDCTITGRTFSDSDDRVLELIVNVPMTSLCPCSKEISKYGAHNQRGNIEVRVQLVNEISWLEDLIEIVESCGSCEIFPLLKREDEKFVTEAAYENPKFVEDIVRAASLKLDAVFADFKVVVRNFESIHNHSAYAVIARGTYVR